MTFLSANTWPLMSLPEEMCVTDSAGSTPYISSFRFLAWLIVCLFFNQPPPQLQTRMFISLTQSIYVVLCWQQLLVPGKAFILIWPSETEGKNLFCMFGGKDLLSSTTQKQRSTWPQLLLAASYKLDCQQQNRSLEIAWVFHVSETLTTWYPKTGHL